MGRDGAHLTLAASAWDFPGRIVLLGGIFAAHVPYVGSCFVPLEFKLFHPGPDSSEVRTCERGDACVSRRPSHPHAASPAAQDLLWQLEEAEAVIPAQADPHLPDPVRKTLETSFRGALPTASFVHGVRVPAAVPHSYRDTTLVPRSLPPAA